MAKKSSGTEVVALGNNHFLGSNGMSMTIMNAGRAVGGGTAELPKKSVAIQKPEGGGDKIALWGLSNDFPNVWELEIEANDTLSDAVEKEVDRIVSGGIEYGFFEINEKGGRTFKAFYDEEIEDFVYSDATLVGLEQFAKDYVMHRFPCPELVFAEDKSKVIAVVGQPAAHIRLELQNESTGWIDYAYLNRNWALGQKSDNEMTIALPTIDPTLDDIELIKTETGITNYFYRVPLAMSRTYYPISPAYTAKTSKWLDINGKLVDFFDSSLDNQMSPKYHIEVESDWFERKYGERWTNATSDEVNLILAEELKWFHDTMHGPQNAGKNLMTGKGYDQKRNAEVSYWKITKLDGSVFEEGYIALSAEAERHIRTSVGLDASLQGATKSGMGAGSGSDKREAFNISMATAYRHISKLLSAFVWAAKYNGWKAPNGQNVVFRINTPFLQTLNNVTPKERETVPADK